MAHTSFSTLFSKLRFPSILKSLNRRLNCGGDIEAQTALVLGVWSEDADVLGQVYHLTKTADDFNKRVEGRLLEYMKMSGPVPRRGETRIFYGIDKRYQIVCLAGLGDECVSYNEEEQMDEWKEAIRSCAASGCRALQDIHAKMILIESFGHTESAAEGAAMGMWMFQELKNPEKQKEIPRLELFEDCDYTGWQIGLQKAAAQNLSRQFCETPSNLLTPTSFAQASVEVLCKAGVNVEVKVQNWAKLMGMHAFLASARGSCEPPIFMETSYFGCDVDSAPIVLIGKGVTFTSGGLCERSSSDMKHMRGDMAGAACVVATCRAAAALQLPINIRGIIPLLENIPGTCAMKPGDIVRARNGKTILVEDTDFDGRLCLADALSYSNNFNPKFVMDIGTLCKETEGGFGMAASAVFSNNEELYEQLRIASIHTGDRIWRMPLWDHFSEKVTSHSICDVGDRYRATGAPCSCAAFLREFVPPVDWIHVDTYGVNRSDGRTFPYLRRGMSGRPTRTIIEFLAQLACQSTQMEATA